MTKVRTTFETLPPSKRQGYRVVLNVDIDTTDTGPFTTQNIVIYSGLDKEMAERIANGVVADVSSGGCSCVERGPFD